VSRAELKKRRTLVREMHRDGLSAEQISRALDVSQETIRRDMRIAGVTINCRGADTLRRWVVKLREYAND